MWRAQEIKKVDTIFFIVYDKVVDKILGDDKYEMAKNFGSSKS